MRLDVYLFANDYVKSRQKAKNLIEEGNVTVDGLIIKKPAFEIDEGNSHLININDSCPYVSRGGLKLEKILKELKLDLNGKTAIDIGSSTGGFTHCLLNNGVTKVYAVDSGKDQLHESLLNDVRVVSIERFNAKELSKDIIGEKVDIITCDVSFISQTHLISAVSNLLKSDGIYIGLIKPQFEVGKGKLNKRGIVNDPKHRLDAIKKVIYSCLNYDLKCFAIYKSPIQGGDGNIEYIAAFSKCEKAITFEKIMDMYK